ncbi:NAD-dependent epimerase [Allomuricauda sp.]|uniref:NAD-dependent epimerase n=1 Tax=Flagellimonas alginolytica TaxID=3177515 RepID=UPI0025D7D0D2|nr:NAD-dependent epimerase [Allomuricauda sp.]
MKILVTGAAGFIGFHVSKKLLEHGHTVLGLDNLNDYYDVNLKLDRLKQLGVHEDIAGNLGKLSQSDIYDNFGFVRLDVQDKKDLLKLFQKENFEVVCHLAAQAGVRYSLENPTAYIESNIVGFFNILECCRIFKIKHLVYASSSSVYGLNKKVPFETSDSVDHPVSLYAASKKSNELMAHTYSHLYGLRTTGLRFFTVYGPWGRPDMAMFLFTKAIINDQPIKVFNNGDLERDFTYIDDIVEGVIHILEDHYSNAYSASEPYHLYNIGNSKSVRLLDFIETIEVSLDKKATKEMMPMQAGDVKRTWADVTGLKKDYNYEPSTPVKVGVDEFIQWYKGYYGR